MGLIRAKASNNRQEIIGNLSRNGAISQIKVWLKSTAGKSQCTYYLNGDIDIYIVFMAYGRKETIKGKYTNGKD